MKIFRVLSILVVVAAIAGLAVVLAGESAKQGGRDLPEDVLPPGLPKVYLDKSAKKCLAFIDWQWRQDAREGGWVLLAEMQVKEASLITPGNTVDYVLYAGKRRIIKAGTAFKFSSPEAALREKEIWVAIPIPGYIKPSDIQSIDLSVK